MKRYIALFVVTACAIVTAATPQPTTLPSFKNRDASIAVHLYDRKEDEARRAYADATRAARDELLKRLDLALAQATKAAQLDEAVKIRDFAAAVKATGVPARAPTAAQPGKNVGVGGDLVRTLAGTRWTEVRDAWTLTLTDDAGAASTHHGELGTWAPATSLGPSVIRLSIGRNTCSGYPLKVSDDGQKLLTVDGATKFTRVK